MEKKQDFIIEIGAYKIPVLIEPSLKPNEFRFIQDERLTDEQKRRIIAAFGVPDKYLPKLK